MLFLDEDPIVCANATPYGFVSSIRSAIEEALTLTGRPNIQYSGSSANCIYYDLCFSKENTDWYEKYYNQLGKIIYTVTGEEVAQKTFTFDNVYRNGGYETNPLKIHNIALDDTYENFFEEFPNLYELTNNIKLSRTILDLTEPEFSDFVFGIPQWFLSNKGILMEDYDLKNRRHIKIVKTDGGLRYFTAILSNNYKEIKNVPPEMQVVVEYILSNRPNLPLIDES